MNIAILGNCFGDEGKGAITHHLSPQYDWVVRFNGGANAGHTIYRDGKKYVHNLLPSVDFRVPQIKSYLGSGMVIDLEKLTDEIVQAEKDFPGVAKRIYIDKNAFIVEEKHKDLDKKNNSHIGTTNRGIGPAYMDKVGRTGTRIHNVLNGYDPYYNDIIRPLFNMGVNFVNLLQVRDEMSRAKILYEGAQGILLDINHGIYPYVSSSDCTLGGIYANGFHFAPPTKVYGVGKCYSTKVGEGPFPTEIEDEATQNELRKRGNEYGATTGRPRRVGWLDLAALKYTCKVAGITDLIITKFDILNGMKEVPVALFYEKEPLGPSDFFNTKPIYINMPGWETCEEVTRNEDGFEFIGHEESLCNFIAQIEKQTECRVSYISCGIEPKHIIKWQ
jgi:adenylosuccinate synthase